MPAPEPITLSRDLDPWERQPGESTARHGWFLAYVELGTERSYAKAARALDKNPVHIRQLAAAYHWKDRAAAKDADDRRIDRLNTLSARIVATRDDAKLLLMLRARCAIYARDLDFSSLTVPEFLKLLETVLRGGRALFGGAGDVLADLGGTEAGQAGGDPFAAEVEAWSSMGPGARAEQMRHLTRQAEARLVAMSGMDDP